LLGPPRQKPSATREHLLRRLYLKPGKLDLAVTLLDERAGKLNWAGSIIHVTKNGVDFSLFLVGLQSREEGGSQSILGVAILT
jgi:hypothetical protein